MVVEYEFSEAGFNQFFNCLSIGILFHESLAGIVFAAYGNELVDILYRGSLDRGGDFDHFVMAEREGCYGKSGTFPEK